MPPRDTYTIGQLAREAGVKPSTIRFYERSGLVEPQTRTPAGYRLYSEQTLERICFIRTAQQAGFTLADARLLLEWLDEARCETVRSLLEGRAEHLGRRIDELTRQKQSVERLLAICRQQGRGRFCPAIEHLTRALRPESRSSERSTASPTPPSEPCT